MPHFVRWNYNNFTSKTSVKVLLPTSSKTTHIVTIRLVLTSNFRRNVNTVFKDGFIGALKRLPTAQVLNRKASRISRNEIVSYQTQLYDGAYSVWVRAYQVITLEIFYFSCTTERFVDAFQCWVLNLVFFHSYSVAKCMSNLHLISIAIKLNRKHY